MAPQRPDPIAYLTGRLNQDPRPPGVSLPGGGGKFATDGSVQTWPGNTFICHVDPASPEHQAIRALQERIKTSRFARLFTFLPPSSFHMTVFQGISPTTCLPDVPEGTSRDAQTAMMLERVEGLRFPPEPRVCMVDLFAGHSLTMTGADDVEETALRRIRAALRDATGIVPEDFDDYVFHISLCYLIDWVTPPLAREILKLSSELTDEFCDEVGSFPLGTVEFCNFETMHHFEALRRLA